MMAPQIDESGPPRLVAPSTTSGALRALFMLSPLLVATAATAAPDASCTSARNACDRMRAGFATGSAEFRQEYARVCTVAQQCANKSCDSELTACRDAQGAVRNTGTDDAKAKMKATCDAYTACADQNLRGTVERVRPEVLFNEQRRAIQAYEKQAALQHKAAENAEREAEAAEASKDLNEALSRLSNDVGTMQVVRSATLCHFAAWRADLLKEIATQKKYGRVGGVTNLSSLYALQQKLRTLDEQSAAELAELKDIKKPALACSSQRVRRVMTYAVPTDGVPEEEYDLAVTSQMVMTALKNADVQ